MSLSCQAELVPQTSSPVSGTAGTQVVPEAKPQSLKIFLSSASSSRLKTRAPQTPPWA